MGLYEFYFVIQKTKEIRRLLCIQRGNAQTFSCSGSLVIELEVNESCWSAHRIKILWPKAMWLSPNIIFFLFFFVVFCFVFFSILTETNTVPLGRNELFTVNREAGKKEGFDRSHKALHRLCWSLKHCAHKIPHSSPHGQRKYGLLLLGNIGELFCMHNCPHGVKICKRNIQIQASRSLQG